MHRYINLIKNGTEIDSSNQFQCKIVKFVSFGYNNREILATVGLSKYKMKLPTALADDGCAYMEFCMEFPKGTIISGKEDYFQSLSHIAKSISEGCWYGYGHTIYLPSLAPFTAVMLIPFTHDGYDVVFEIEGGNSATLYKLVPLYASEFDFRINTDGATLMKRGQNTENFGLYDPNRPHII